MGREASELAFPRGSVGTMRALRLIRQCSALGLICCGPYRDESTRHARLQDEGEHEPTPFLVAAQPG